LHIIRELLMGGLRFNKLQRGLSLTSPTVLSKRLESLPEQGLVLKKKIPGQKGDEVDLCVKDPEKDIDVYFTSTVKTLVDIWMGDSSYKQAVKQGNLKLISDKNLTQNMSAGLSNSLFTDLPVASEI
jgi:hypothetical protein